MDNMNQLGIVASQEEKNKISIAVQTEQTITLRRRLDLDKSISTPPSELRKEIYHLRDELSEAYEFHDLELQILKEDYDRGTAELITGKKNVNDLEKSLKDAEQIILEANKEISNLKTTNQDLNKKLEDEYNKYEALKTEHGDETSKLQIILNKKDVEIENLKKDKCDFDFRLELIHENYNRRISELKSALDKENENERNQSFDELQRRLYEENEKTKNLSKKLEDLNAELLLNKEKVKLLQVQLAESSKLEYSRLLRDISLQTESLIQENSETILKVASLRENRAEVQHEISIDEININLLFKDEETTTTNESTKEELVDVSVQTSENREIEEIRTSFEKEIKELKDDHNTKLKCLECSNEDLLERNLCLTEKLNAANKAIEELKEKLVISTENVDNLRRQLEEIKLTELESKETANNSLQCGITENLQTELENKIKELQSENDSLLQKISNITDELELTTEEVQALKQDHEKQLKDNYDWESRYNEQKLEIEALNGIISGKEEEIKTLIGELNEKNNKLEDSEKNLRTYVRDTKNCIDLLSSEKEELQIWIKRKEDEMSNLNVVVENELIKLKMDSELKIEDMRKMYDVEIKNLKNENGALYEQMESIRNMYEAEVLKFVNLIEKEKREDCDEGEPPEENNTMLERCIAKIKHERDSIVEMFNSRVLDASISANVNAEDISDASTVIQQSSAEEVMSLVPVRTKGRYSDETIGNYKLHTVDEENMQLNITSESAMMDFVNEFAKEMLRENIINPEELKTCTNIFYSLLNKHLLLIEMYSRLKQEFEDYKINEEKERFDVLNRTVRYLDTLCSQLEVSGSSLNLSNSSFVSFHEGIPSSTIMEEDYTEMEITAVNNVTMSKDPLALTQDITLKTPLKTPLKSGKKANQFPFKTPLRSVSKSVKTPLRPESVKKPILRTPASVRPEKFSSDTQLVQLKNSIVRKDKELNELKDLYSIKIASAEDVMQDTLKNLALLEKRIAKLETLSAELQTERENLIKESAGLRELLTKSSEEISDIRGKLIVEIISLNRELEGTFSAVSVTDLLSVFIHTIMESCKKMPEELSEKLMAEVEALTEKNEIYEGKIFESAKEMNLLKEINEALMGEKEVAEKKILDQNEIIEILKQETSELNMLRSKTKDLEERLIENDSILQTEIYLKENTLKDLQKLKMFFEDVEKENSSLKEKIEQSDKAIHDLKTELMLARKEQVNNEIKEDELLKEIEELKSILSVAEERNKDLQNVIDNFEEEVSSVNSKNKYKTCQLELLSNKISHAENVIQERDETIQELKQEIAEVEGKLGEFSDFSVKYKNSQTEIEQLRQTVDGCKESVNEEMESLKNKLSAADSDLVAKTGMIQELSTQLKEAGENARVQGETITELKEQVGQLENEIEKLKALELELEKREEAEKVMADEIEHLKTKIISSETDLTSKSQDIEKLSIELDKAEELKLQNELTVSRMKQYFEELQGSREKLKSVESALEKYKEVERTMREETELLKSRLLVSEAELKDKTEKLAEMTEFIGRTKEEFTARVQEMESDMDKMRETEKNMAQQIEDLDSRLAASETENSDMATKIEETNEINVRIISTLQKEAEELRSSNLKLQVAIEKYEESERIKLKELEELNLKLSSVESDLAVKIEMVEKISKEGDRVKTAYEDTISRHNEEIENLKRDVFNFETVQNLLEVVRNERNEKEMIIEDLNSRLNEFTASERLLNLEVDSLRMRLTAAEENTKALQEKLTEMGEIESELIKTKDTLEELRTDNETRKQVENELSKVTKELESRNTQLETVNGELSRQVQSFEVLYDMNCKEIQMLREELTASEENLNSRKAEMEAVEKGLKEIQTNIEEAIAKLKSEVKSAQQKYQNVLPAVAIPGTSDSRKDVIEKVNALFRLHTQQVESLKQELKDSKETSQNLKTEIDKLNGKVGEEVMCKTEISIPLKTPPAPRRNRTGDSPSFISRRLEKLENLNDLLTGTLQKIVRALDVPFEDNLFSVGRYATSEAQIMKYISSLNVTPKGEQIDKFEELSKEVKELRNTVSSVVAHVGLPHGSVNGQIIINNIDKMVADVKKDFLDRIDVLRQDNQHLDDDNNLLQTEMKKLVEQNNQNKTKLNALSMSEELLKVEVESLKAEITKLQSKSKINRKNDLCNRKLDKLEEVHQSLIDLIKKMLALIGMENLAKLNLCTMRQFEIESKKVWDYFNGWVSSKAKEMEELKSQMKELDEECESYSKVIIEARQETERIWEKSRAEVKNLELQIAELQEENRDLLEKVKTLQSGGSMNDRLGSENGAKETEELKKQNIALRSRIKDLEDSLLQARKQVEELDEECESYAKVIKETQRESLLCEETKNEIKALKEDIEKMEKEKEALQERIRVLESSNTGGRKDGKELKELKRTVALREMKILELEQLNEKNVIHKSQIKYLENSVAMLKDQLAQEESKNQKLQQELEELSLRTHKRKAKDDVELLDQLRTRDSLGMAALHQIDDKEKLQKLEKDNRMLKEICRSRYNEIKRLETENQNLKGHERTTKNSNQMDSPIRTRCYNTRFKKC